MKRNKIPDEFKVYFWDCKFKDLDMHKHKKFIMERLLNLGSFNTFNWIFNNFKREEVESFLKEYGKIRLSRNSYNFWKFVLGINQLWK